MATRNEQKSVEPSSKGRRNRATVIVYQEVSVTVPMGGTQHIKVTFGHERTASSDSDEALMKAEKAAWDFNQKIIDKRVRLLRRMVRQIESEG